MAESTPELRIRGVIDLSEVRASLRGLQQDAARGLNLGGTSGGATFGTERAGGTAAGLVTPAPIGVPIVNPTATLQANIYRRQFYDTVSGLAGGGDGGDGGEEGPPGAPGRGGRPAGFGRFATAYFVLREARELGHMLRRVDEANFTATLANSPAGFYQAEARRIDAVSSGFVGTLLTLGADLAPKTGLFTRDVSPSVQKQRLELSAREEEQDDELLRGAIQSGGELSVQTAYGRGGPRGRRSAAVAAIQVRGTNAQLNLDLQIQKLRDVNTAVLARGVPNLSLEEIQAVKDRSDQIGGLQERREAIGTQTAFELRVENDGRLERQRAALFETQADTRASRLRTAGFPIAARVSQGLAAGALAQARADSPEEGEAGMRRALQGVAEDLGNAFRGAAQANLSNLGTARVANLRAAGNVRAAGLAQIDEAEAAEARGIQDPLLRAFTAIPRAIAATARRRAFTADFDRGEELQVGGLESSARVAELQADRRPIAARIAEVQDATTLSFNAVLPGDPRGRERREAIRRRGIAELRQVQNEYADAGSAQEVEAGTVLPGAGGRGRFGGPTEDVQGQVAAAISKLTDLLSGGGGGGADPFGFKQLGDAIRALLGG